MLRDVRPQSTATGSEQLHKGVVSQASLRDLRSLSFSAPLAARVGLSHPANFLTTSPSTACIGLDSSSTSILNRPGWLEVILVVYLGRAFTCVSLDLTAGLFSPEAHGVFNNVSTTTCYARLAQSPSLVCEIRVFSRSLYQLIFSGMILHVQSRNFWRIFNS